MDETTAKNKEKTAGRIELHRRTMNQTIGYIVGALGLVAGLAWNEAIRALIDYLFPLSTHTLLAKFLYAFLMTLVVVIATTWLVRFQRTEEQE